MIHKNVLRFNRCKTINIGKSELRNEVREPREAAMLLPLRRPLWDAVTFCAFGKIREPTAAEEATGTTVGVRDEGVGVSEIWLEH